MLRNRCCLKVHFQCTVSFPTWTRHHCLAQYCVVYVLHMQGYSRLWKKQSTSTNAAFTILTVLLASTTSYQTLQWSTLITPYGLHMAEPSPDFLHFRLVGQRSNHSSYCSTAVHKCSNAHMQLLIRESCFSQDQRMTILQCGGYTLASECTEVPTNNTQLYIHAILAVQPWQTALLFICITICEVLNTLMSSFCSVKWGGVHQQ